MRSAIELADRLDAPSILRVHAALLGSTNPSWAGRWREEQVWIGGGDWSPHGADFVPPHHEHVPAAVDDLVLYLARDDIEPLVQAAVAHAQFETIHPFPDGNGRVGRALVHALLRAKELTRQVTVPVSAGLLTGVTAYFGALDRYRLGDPEAIVELLSRASFAAIGNGRRLVGELRDLGSRWREVIGARSGATAWRLADELLRHPVVDVPAARAFLDVADMTAARAIDRLAGAGILTQVAGQQRNRKWAALEVLGALDAFAARAGRRASG
jgi:Fic family protein